MDGGDRFDELYRAQYDSVLRYALRRTDPETARDAVAETFLVAWRRLDSVPADQAQATPWLYGVARNVLANADRSRRRTERITAKLSRQRLPQFAPETDRAIVERARLQRALAKLKPGDREALRLIGWEELDVAEAALAMGCSSSTMAVRLHRARRRLERALLAADSEEAQPTIPRPSPAHQVRQETP
jgi:RNA polymerase sigma factor (sigma-70 family)